MLCKGIPNPTLLELLARIRHTNTLVIADRGFPCWLQMSAIVLFRTGDTVQYANLIIESA